MAAIVVGIDGSEESKGALRWAFEEARLRQARLVCVHAWTIPLPNPPMLTNELIDALRKDARELLDTVVTEVVGDADDVELARTAVEGSPAQVLIAACEEADLLVVGSRGMGGFAGLIAGSVSQHCARHAPCPVVIVPPRRTRQER